ncbi:MAG: hypothetical protein JXR37_31365 [Kiritimatiellae bacterium]|nr:hypothetical protein [Kiritimatiellia bacterium]
MTRAKRAHDASDLSAVAPGAKAEARQWVAWSGWSLRAPAAWRPLDIEQNGPRGRMMLGGATKPILQIKWWQPRGKRFDAAAWIRRRLRSVAGAAAPGKGPAPHGFAGSAWVELGAPRAGGRKAIWYGYAPEAGLMIEAVLAGDLSPAEWRQAVKKILPSLRASKRGGPTQWAVFGVSFESPPGYVLDNRRLNLGDMALRFTARGGSRIVLRQVYPASLALARRDMKKWLRDAPFKEHRAHRPAGEPEAWRLDCPARELSGLKRDGWKRLPFPMGWCRPRFAVTAVIEDRELDRLLLAECSARRPQDDKLLGELLAGMNWAQRNGTP